MQENIFFELCARGSLSDIMEAVKARANLKARDEDGLTPLMFAARKNDHRVVNFLISAGADINARDIDGKTPLMWAAFENSDPIVVYVLVDAEADICATDKDGITALSWAARGNSNPKVVKLIILISKIISLIRENELHEFDDRVNIVCEALDVFTVHYANGYKGVVDVKDVYGMTPLMWAVRENPNPKVVEVLVKAEDPTSDTTCDDRGYRGYTPLMLAIARNSNSEIINVLIREARYPVDGRYSHSGTTSLILAAISNLSPDVIISLLKLGADAKKRDSHGKKAIDYAKENEALRNTDVFWELNDVSY